MPEMVSAVGSSRAAIHARWPFLRENLRIPVTSATSFSLVACGRTTHVSKYYKADALSHFAGSRLPYMAHRTVFALTRSANSRASTGEGPNRSVMSRQSAAVAVTYDTVVFEKGWGRTRQIAETVRKLCHL